MDIPTYVYNILNSVKIGQISPEVHTDFTQRTSDPAYLDALICFLCNPNEDPTIRSIAGHSLKSNLQGINDPQSVCVRITACLTEENPTVRKALYSVYSTGFAKWGWCDALLFIQNSFSSTATSGYGLELLSLIAEDLTPESAQFLADPSRSNTLEGIIYSLLGYIRCGELLAVTCYTRLLSVRLPQAQAQAHQFCAVCSEITEIKHEIVEAYAWLTMISRDVVENNFQAIGNYMNAALDWEEDNIVKEVCQFLQEFAESQILTDYVPIISPKLLKRLILTDVDIEALMQSDEDHYARQEEKVAASWTVRQQAIETITSISEAHAAEMYPLFWTTFVEIAQSSTDWKQIECGILALGIIAPNLAYIDVFNQVETALKQYINENALLASTIIWTYSRFSDYFIKSSDLSQGYLRFLVEKIQIQDDLVRAAAFTAFTTILTKDPTVVSPHLTEILEQIQGAIPQFQRKSILSLLDTLNTIIDILYDELTDEHISLLQTILNVFWDGIADNDKILWTLFEVMYSFIVARPDWFNKSVSILLVRCINIIRSGVDRLPTADFAEKQFTVKSWDLINAVLENCEVEQIMMENGQNLLDLAVKCAPDSDPKMRQYVASTLFNLLKQPGVSLIPSIPMLVPDLVSSLYVVAGDSWVLSACNNCLLILTEIMVTHPEHTSTFVTLIATKVIATLEARILNDDIYNQYKQSALVCLGRLGCVNSAELAPQLPRFAKHWMLQIHTQQNTPWKEQTFLGMTAAMRHNIATLYENFQLWLDSLHRYREASAQIIQENKGLLQALNQEQDITEDIARLPQHLNMWVKETFN